MQARNILQDDRFILHRPRVNTILKKGLETPLMILVSPLGFGKTTAVASFAQGLDNPVVWFNLSSLANDVDFFWDMLISSVKKEWPELAQVIAGLSFPDTDEKFADYFLAIEKVIKEDTKRLVIVVDNPYLITNPFIQQFFLNMTKLNEQRNLLCNIFISNEKVYAKKADYKFVDKSVTPYYIRGREISFTPKEIERLFHLYDIKLTEEEAQDLYDKTAGWAMILKHICETSVKDSTFGQLSSDLQNMACLFQNQYYSEYSATVQKVFAGLSVLPFFSADIIRDIAGDEFGDVIDALEDNLFIQYDYTTYHYTYHKWYQLFLRSKSKQLPENFINKVRDSAGSYYFKINMNELSRKMYFTSKNYKAFVETVMQTAPHRASEINAILDMFDLLPISYYIKDPYALFCVAQLLYNKLEINDAKKVLFLILNRHQEGIGVVEDDLLAEIYILLANIAMTENNTDGLDYIKKAAGYLTDVSPYAKNYHFNYAQNDLFYLPDNKVGSLEKMIKYVREFGKYNDMVAPFDGAGAELLFEAEAMYYQGDMLKVQNMAFQAIFKAKANKQYGTVVSAHYLLAKTAVHMGDYDKMVAHLSEVTAYLENEKQAEMLKMVKMVQKYLEKQTGVDTQENIKEKRYVVNIYEDIPFWQGRNLIINVFYLLVQEQFFEAMAILSEAEYLLTKRPLWTVQVEVLLGKAVVFFHMDEKEKALSEFTQAYHMIYENNLYVLVAQFGRMITPLIRYIKSQKLKYLDNQWIDFLLQEAIHFNDNVQKLAKAYRVDKGKNFPGDSHLSPRERTVLYYLVQGHTREQISQEMNISINGVKKHLSNIYVKLGAKNRAEAIHFATLRQLTPTE